MRWSVMRQLPAVSAMALVLTSGAGLADGDPEQGETLFRPCAACHMIGEGAVHRIGPHLNGLVGRQIGTLEGYRYSEPMIEAGHDGQIWTQAALGTFLEDPRGTLPGTRMVFRGIREEADRIDLIAYLLGAGGPAEASVETGEEIGPSPEIVAILAIDGDVAYGEYLSSECTACHSGTGAESIPAISGLEPSAFASGLVAYRTGERQHQVMNMVSARLGDEEIAALAAYFASVQP